MHIASLACILAIPRSGILWLQDYRLSDPRSRLASYEDGIAFGLEQLRAFNPTHIVGCLGPQSVEILRYVSTGVSRVGMAQTDDPPVYWILAHYAPVLDATMGVSHRSGDVVRTFAQLRNKPICYQPYVLVVSDLPKWCIRQVFELTWWGETGTSNSLSNAAAWAGSRSRKA
ncbi:MAG TPA: hypothetical protein VGD78_08120 [Chthoniobacterales bacterium]